jgi:hypothetical protein
VVRQFFLCDFMMMNMNQQQTSSAAFYKNDEAAYQRSAQQQFIQQENVQQSQQLQPQQQQQQQQGQQGQQGQQAGADGQKPVPKKINIVVKDIVEDRSIKRDGQVKRYKTGKCLGKGGFAKCYELTSFDTHRTYAGKIIPKASLQRKSAKQKLLNEIKIHRSLSHPYVVKFERFFEDSDNVYILLELCSQQTLMELGT